MTIADPGTRGALRAATAAVHQRLHSHDGFLAILAGTITLAEYRALLMRLLGFYDPFERAARLPGERQLWLAADLAALGIDPPSQAGLPRCSSLPRLINATRCLGAQYVAEGALFGGRELARGLDGLLGVGEQAGRRFLLGRGSATVSAWQLFLMRLEAAGSEATAREEMTTAAAETFRSFERWMTGWQETPCR